ncbi:MAG: TaqI-like C-terminal specificity domain-containing protein [Dehalococcoidia bacterium]|nr:TaqI-like C-terminal specificity domain-containing protein [Dehalococcoidia bacterium]
MDRLTAARIIRETFEKPFDRDRFTRFVKELLNRLDTSNNFVLAGNRIPNAGAFQPFVNSMERIGKYSDGDHKMDCLIVNLKKETSLEHARPRQRNFVARYLQGTMGGDLKDAALVAFVPPDSQDWRFSLVKVDYRLDDEGKLETELTPSRRYSFLVRSNESSHTAQTQLLPLLQDDVHNPTLTQLEEAFNIERVTKEFYERYRQLFIDVKEALDKLVAADPQIRFDFAAKGVNTVDFSKKLLGQVIFLYFLQKKGWLGVPEEGRWGDGDRRFLRTLFDRCRERNQNFFNDCLEYLFYDALNKESRGGVDPSYYHRLECRIPFLNGGLFDPEYDWGHTEIILPNGLFSNRTGTSEEGSGILDIFDLYNFTVKEDEPLEKEVAIDPEMLGKIFEKLCGVTAETFEDWAKAIKSKKKAEENKFNKKFGVYYTPREIVHYMCQESLIDYLDNGVNTGKVPLAPTGATQAKLFGQPDPKQTALEIIARKPMIPRADIEAFVHMGEFAEEHEGRIVSLGKETERYSHVLPKSISDNAGTLDEKLAGIKVCDPAVGSGAFLVGMMHETVKARRVLNTYLGANPERTPYRFKRQCIQNSLYGVDIDPGAVEIAKLRLWLSLVVDEQDIRQIDPLPNLDYKVVQGDSILDVQKNMLNWHLFEKVEELIPLHFRETNAERKHQYKAEIDELISRMTEGDRAFSFDVYFSSVMRNGGFDVVIANPPYVRQEQIKDLKPELQRRYNCYTGVADIYVYFYERGFRLLRENGTLTFISSNKYFRSGYGEKLRRFLAGKGTVHRLIDFGDAPVFDEAIAYPSIIILSKRPPDANRSRVLTWEPGIPIERFESEFRAKSFLMLQKELTPDGWRLESPAVLRLMEKLRKAGKPLGEYVNGRFYRGVLTGLNEAFVVDRATRDRLIAEHPSSAEVLKPFLRGRDVKRWRVEPQDLWLIFTRHGINIKKYPAIRAHLEKFRTQLMPKPDDWDEDKKGKWPGRKPGSYEWYEIQDNIAYWHEFERSKITYPDITDECAFALDSSSLYPDCTLFMVPEGSSYLLSILNSSVNRFFFPQICPKVRGNFMRFKSIYVEQIPIPSCADPKPIETLVERILTAKSANPEADVSALERQIDELVYRLYGLTAEEIGVVEEGAGRK